MVRDERADNLRSAFEDDDEDWPIFVISTNMAAHVPFHKFYGTPHLFDTSPYISIIIIILIK